MHVSFCLSVSCTCPCICVCVFVNLIIFLGEWISPTVTGDRPPPICLFTLTSVTNNSAILFGGSTNECSYKMYIIDFTKTSVVS